MKTDKLKMIVNFLLDNQRSVTNKELAALLEVSPRSISNYVKEINYNHDEKIIVSTKNGYTINRKQAAYYLTTSENILPSTYEERSMYIVKLLLIKQAKINLFDLSEQLYVSFSTLKNDLNKMNKSFKSFGIKFVTENNLLVIKGNEKDKRRLVSYAMFEESNGNFLNIERIEKTFEDTDVTALSEMIRQVAFTHNYYLNDFAFLNLLLHLTIAIKRIQSGHNVNNNDLLSIPKKDQDLTSDLQQQISELFQLSLSEQEEYEIYLLFKINATQSLQHSVDDLKQIIDDNLMEFTKTLIKFINEHFFIDLMNDNFVTPFVLHLKNLLLRVKQNINIKNPLTESIKFSTPSIYDIATSIGLKINEHFSTRLSEDEIAYLALHIGNEIERQKQDAEKIKTVLLCPEYMSLKNNLLTQLSSFYNQSITINAEVSFESELVNAKFDMIISTVPVSENFKASTIQISPFLTTADQQLVNDGIINFQMSKKTEVLRNNFDKYFSDKLFFLSNSGRTKDDVLTKLTNSLEKQSYTDKVFQAHVFEREEASSTAFKKIAIPHSVKMEAMKTGIAMVISDKGIEWKENQTVHIVFLVAINQLDKMEFRLLYEALVDLFIEPDMIEKARKCVEFQEFRNLVLSVLS